MHHKQHAEMYDRYGTHVSVLSLCTSVEVTSVDALFDVEDALVVLHEAAQFLSQLQGHVLQGRGLCAVHHHSLCGLVQRCLMGKEQRGLINTYIFKKADEVLPSHPPRTTMTKLSRCKIHHQLLVDDHFADDAVNSGDLQLKHFRECLHAKEQTQ